MAKNKTQPTDVTVEEFIGKIENEVKRKEAEELHALFVEATGEKGKMWGPSIIGYGTYHYKYESGREGDFLRAGFSPRKAAHSLYIMGSHDLFRELLDQLGKYKTGKSCIYVKKLADINLEVLKDLVQQSYKYIGEKTWP